MILRRSSTVVLDGEEGESVLFHVQQKVVNVEEKQLDAFIVERSIRQHSTELKRVKSGVKNAAPNLSKSRLYYLYEKPQKVNCAVDFAHRGVGMFLEYVSVLFSFELVQQLRSEHHIKVFAQTRCHFEDGVFLLSRRG